jgi:DNA modification methylase
LQLHPLVRNIVEEDNSMNSSRISLHSICPYFAMFPETFVREQVEKYSNEGDIVFDPFCGRGTTILEALLLGRRAAGSDINPVAYCVAQAKAQRPKLKSVLDRLDQLEDDYLSADAGEWDRQRLGLPPFFRRAFFSSTLREIFYLRNSLDWRFHKTERFIMALILGSLHGEMDHSRSYFSNQMPRTICLKPEYSLRYWREHGLYPRKKDVFPMLRDKATQRLKDLPDYSGGEVKLIDSRKAAGRFRSLRKQVSLVITSPPYLNVTRYEEDQWLRLWMLGGPPEPTYGKISKDDRHASAARYWRFLTESWAGIAPLMKKSFIIVIRLGAIGINQEEITSGIKASIKQIFPSSRLLEHRKSPLIRRQTQRFLPRSDGCKFEIDFIFAS